MQSKGNTEDKSTEEEASGFFLSSWVLQYFFFYLWNAIVDEYISFGYKYYFFLYFVHFYLYILTKGCSQASLSYTWKSYSVRVFCVLLCCELV